MSIFKTALLFGLIGPLLPLFYFTAFMGAAGSFGFVLAFVLLFGVPPAILTGIVYGYLVSSDSLSKGYDYLIHPLVAAALGGFFSACLPLVVFRGWLVVVFMVGGAGALSAAALALVIVFWQRLIKAKAQASTG